MLFEGMIVIRDNEMSNNVLSKSIYVLEGGFMESWWGQESDYSKTF